MVEDCIEAGLHEPEYREEQGALSFIFIKMLFVKGI
jgi:hypothetical protein